MINSARHLRLALFLYLAAYIHLYRFYKSLPILVKNNFSKTIDTFIDCCMSEKTDHPATLAYNTAHLHEVFRLKKINFQLFKDYLEDHEVYRNVLELQNKHHQTESQMRKIRKAYKQFLKEEAEKAEKKVEPAIKEEWKNRVYASQVWGVCREKIVTIDAFQIFAYN